MPRELSVVAEWSDRDGEAYEVLSLGWESGGWTADGVVRGIDVHYVVRVDEHGLVVDHPGGFHRLS